MSGAVVNLAATTPQATGHCAATDARLVALVADQLEDRRRLRLRHRVALVLVARALVRSLGDAR